MKSKLEERVFKDLSEAFPSVKYEGEILNYTTTNKYKPDFVVDRVDGSKSYIEAKGYFRYEDRRKMQAVKEANPDLDIRLVFERNNPIRKNNSNRYSDWAEKNGFQYAVGSIPEEWKS